MDESPPNTTTHSPASSPHHSPSTTMKKSVAAVISGTPATVTSETSSPVMRSLRIQTTANGTLSSASNSPSSNYSSSSSSSSTVWVPKPSPSRARLHTHYAARLAPEYHRSTPNVHNANSSTPRRNDFRMIPPPSVSRNVSVFRPTPILTSPPGETYYSVPRSPTFSPSMRLHSSTSSCASERIMTPQSSRRHRQRSTVAATDVGTSDRFIPNRATSSFTFNLWDRSEPSTPAAVNSGTNSNANNTTTNNNSNNSGSNTDNTGSSNVPSSPDGTPPPNLLNTLLRSELLGENEDPTPSYTTSHHPRTNSDTAFTPIPSASNLLRYTSPRQAFQQNVFADSWGASAIVESFSLNPVRSPASQRLMAQQPKRKRRISKVPFKVLDAPALKDDYYLNLVDWSSQNVLAVALGSCVYLWSACNSKVTKLCDLSLSNSSSSASEDSVTSVSWAQRGTHLAVGTNRGDVELWDTTKGKRIRSMPGHTARVGTLAWHGPTLASGSRDRLIFLRDVRVQSAYTDQLDFHKQEVCGLKWSFDDPGLLASGGNDNDLHVIDSRNPSSPVHKFSEHRAAVKAIAWSPHQHGLLASGGGTSDRCIRFWNTQSGVALHKIDTGSQVCNIAWSRNCNEIVSTHGYSLNQIIVWRYPSMSKVATLTGHSYRVLYLAMSPDGSTVVTGAGDETLRFWQIFPGPQSDNKDNARGLLFPNTPGSVIR
jgi:cell division cycle 20-like protein 1 (cofactor of APC complex)